MLAHAVGGTVEAGRLTVGVVSTGKAAPLPVAPDAPTGKIMIN